MHPWSGSISDKFSNDTQIFLSHKLAEMRLETHHLTEVVRRMEAKVRSPPFSATPGVSGTNDEIDALQGWLTSLVESYLAIAAVFPDGNYLQESFVEDVKLLFQKTPKGEIVGPRGRPRFLYKKKSLPHWKSAISSLRKIIH